MQRYTVRRSGEGCGVWDSATNGWRSATNLDERAAEYLAEQMNADEQGTRAVARIYVQDPAKPCEVFLEGRWWAGHLTEWGRGNDGSWWGRGTCEWREWRGWVPSSWLRPRGK